MASRANPAVIGGFVLGAIALAVVGLVVVGGGKFFQHRQFWEAYFDESIKGLPVPEELKKYLLLQLLTRPESKSVLAYTRTKHRANRLADFLDKNGIPCAILSYAAMHKSNLPAGGPLDLRLNRSLVRGDEGTERMVGLLRAFVEPGGNMLTLTVVDTEELRVGQLNPDRYRSLRVRMGGWCAYFLPPEMTWRPRLRRANRSRSPARGRWRTASPFP